MVSLQKTDTAIIMIYKNTKAMVCIVNGDTDSFVIVGGVCHGDPSPAYISINCLTHLIKENGFTLKKKKKETILLRTMTNEDYADDLVLLSNSPTQFKSLHSVEQAVGSTRLNVNAD